MNDDYLHSNWDEFNKDLRQKMAREQSDAEHARGPEAAWVPPTPKNPISGVGLGMFLISPFLFLLYLVLGLALWAAVGVAILMGVYLPIPTWVAVAVGIVLYVGAWIFGLRLERKLSQSKPYRFLRGAVRLTGPVALVVVMVASNEFSGAAMFGAIIAIVPFHLLCRLFDRLYFPVWSEVKRKSAMAEQGIPDKRPMIKRLFYAVIWLIPFMAIVQVLILVAAKMLGATSQGEAVEMIAPFRSYIVPGTILLWLILSLMGLLPGTKKHRKSYVDYAVQLEMKDAQN